jgi:predicted nucleotidyltransferase
MSDEQFSLLNKLVLEPMKNHGASVYLFGSRATGRHHPYSDVDLLYSGEIPGIVMSEVKEAIEESSFPFKVDIVRDSELAESYRPTVIQQMIPL